MVRIHPLGFLYKQPLGRQSLTSTGPLSTSLSAIASRHSQALPPLSITTMQVQSTLSRLAAFALLLLSFSMLVCAAPAPASAPDALVARSDSLIARNDVTDACYGELTKLDVNLDVEIERLSENSSILLPLFPPSTHIRPPRQMLPGPTVRLQAHPRRYRRQGQCLCRRDQSYRRWHGENHRED
jgi:hypothetical protein